MLLKKSKLFKNSIWQHQSNAKWIKGEKRGDGAKQQGITLRPCIVHLHIWTLQFPSFSICTSMKFDVVKTQICWLFLLISMCKENLYAKMQKLEAQMCRCTREGLKVRPCKEINLKANPLFESTMEAWRFDTIGEAKKPRQNQKP